MKIIMILLEVTKMNTSKNTGIYTPQQLRFLKKLNAKLSCVNTRDIRPINAKATVVMLHGYRGHMRTLDNLMDELESNNYNILACDLPNHGKSVINEEKRGHIENFKELIQIARAMVSINLILESKKDFPVFIVGYSMGAVIALRLLQTKPNLAKKISGVICIGLPLEVDHNISKKLKRYKWLILPLLPLLRKYYPHLSVHDPKKSENGREIFESPEVVSDPLFHKGPMSLHVALEFYNETNAITDEIKKISTPILFVHGENDKYAPFKAVKKAYIKIRSSDKTLHKFNAEHDITNQNKESVIDIISWLDLKVSEENRECSNFCVYERKNALSLKIIKIKKMYSFFLSESKKILRKKLKEKSL